MGRKNQFEARKKKDSLSRNLKQLDTREGKRDPLIVLSFKDFDVNQGQCFEEWQNEKLLALAIQRLRSICQYTVAQAQQQQLVKIYSKVPFPPDSGFEHPKHVSQDVTWSSISVQGKPRVIGYFENNIFHVVFLDKDHEFWITEKKNT